MAVNPFLRAVPGQSLTDKPGNAAWEHPPQFTDVKKAMDYIFQQLMLKQNLMQLYGLLEHEHTSLEGIAKTIITVGFSKGKWTPTLGMLLMPAVVIMLAGIARKVGMEVPIKMPRIDVAKNMLVKQKLAEKIAKKMKFSPISTNTPSDNLLGKSQDNQQGGGGLMSPTGGQ